jgi:hypothetical protein
LMLVEVHQRGRYKPSILLEHFTLLNLSRLKNILAWDSG